MTSLAQFLRPRRFFESHFTDCGWANSACLDQSRDLSKMCDIRLDEHEGRPNAEASCFFGVAAMKKIKPALDALYQALTPEQRQKADQLIPMG